MDLWYENSKLAHVRVAGMNGSSGIGFFRLMVHLEFIFTSGGDEATLFPLTGRLAVGNRDVGHLFSPAAELTKATPRDYPDTKVLYIDLDRSRIEALEAIRNGGALSLDVHVAGQVISKQHGLCSLRDASDSYQLNQSGWIDILRQMGYGETMLIEVPVTDGIGKTTEYLAAAQKAIGLGHYREAVGACRDVLEALSMGVGDSDERDSDFTALFANTRNKANGITCSMSRRGQCYDNAAMESWFSTFKFELGEKFDSYTEVKEKSFDYIEVFYNQRRLHSSIGYLSPAECERRHRKQLARAEAA